MFDMLILSALLVIPASFYTLATFVGAKYHIKSYWLGLLASVIFATCEYAVKNPIIGRLTAHLSYPTIQGVWLALTLILSYIFQKMNLHQTIASSRL